MAEKKSTFILAIILLILLGSSTIHVLAQQAPLIEASIGVDIFDLAWSPDGQLLATATSTGVKIFDINLTEIIQLTGHTSYVFSVAWKPDGTQLASGGSVGDNSIRIWDYDSVTSEFSLRTVIPTVSNIVSLLKWSPDGTKLASLVTLDTTLTNRPGRMGDVQIWDAQTFEPLREDLFTISDPSRELSWSPDSTRVAIGGTEAVFAIGVELLPNSWVLPLRFAAKAVSWSSDDKVAFASESLDVVAGETGELLYSVEVPSIPSIVYWHPSSEFLLVDGSDSLVTINATTGEVVQSYSLPTGTWPWRFAWCPDGKRLAVVTKDGIIQIWDTSSLANTLSMSTNTVANTPSPTRTPMLTLTPSPAKTRRFVEPDAKTFEVKFAD